MVIVATDVNELPTHCGLTVYLQTCTFTTSATAGTSHPVAQVAVWLEKPAGDLLRVADNHILVSAPQRLILNSSLSHQNAQNAQNTQNTNLWPSLLGSSVYVTHLDVAVLQGQQPLLTKAMTDKMAVECTKSNLRQLFQQSVSTAQQVLRVRAANTLKKVGALSHTERMLIPLVQPIMVDEKETLVDRGQHAPAFVLFETWANMPNKSELVEHLLSQLPRTWTQNLHWINLVMQHLKPSKKDIPNVDVQIWMTGTPDGQAELQCQLDQYQMHCKRALNYQDALTNASKTNTSWHLILERGAVLGPMFVRDMSMIKQVLLHLSDNWDMIKLGYHLPAIETVDALCRPQNRALTFISGNAGLGGQFAVLVTKSFAQTSTITTSTPTRLLGITPPIVFANL
jgi:hypothetical protein